MDELLKSVLPGLGAFGPFAVLAWWIINNQAKQLEARDAHNQQLTERIIKTCETVAQTMAELKAALRGTD
jgi:hypothetical protein